VLHIYICDISSLRVNDLTLILLTWRKWWAPNNASKQQMGFNSAFKGLKCSQSFFSIDNSDNEEELSWLVDGRVVSLLLTGLPRISLWRMWYWSALPQWGVMSVLCTSFRVTKKVIFNARNGRPSVKIVFHKNWSGAPRDVNVNTISNLHSGFNTINYIQRRAHRSCFPRCSRTSPTE